MLSDFITAAASQDDLRNHTWDLVNKAEDYQIRKWEDERHLGYSKDLMNLSDSLYDENELQKFKNVENFYSRNKFSPLAMLGQGFSSSPSIGGSFSPSSTNPQHSDPSSTGQNALALRLQNHQFKVMEKQENLLDEQAITEQTKQAENEASANLKDVEASDKAIDVRRKMNEDDTIHKNMVRFFENLRHNAKTPEERERYNQILNSSGEFTKGALQGLQQFTDYDFKLLQQDLERKIIAAKKAENVPQTLAKIPAAELSKLLIERAKIYQEIASLAQSRQLDEAKIDEIEQRIKLMEREEQSIYHSDPVAMWNSENGDWTTYVLTNAVRDVVHGVGQGVGYGAAAAASRRFDANSPTDLKGLGKKSKEVSETASQSSRKGETLEEVTERVNRNRERKKAEWMRKQAEENSKRMKRIRSGFPDVGELRDNAGAW